MAAPPFEMVGHVAPVTSIRRGGTAGRGSAPGCGQRASPRRETPRDVTREPRRALPDGALLCSPP